jgi:Transposase/zinc-finger of transposase IS204/IS1001/IS1096/IS1165
VIRDDGKPGCTISDGFFGRALVSRIRPRWSTCSSTRAGVFLICGSTFERALGFRAPECGAACCRVHDTERHTWRHLNFFEHEAYLTAKIWRVVHYCVDRPVEAQDLAAIERVGIDDTSFRRAHDYVSLFCDLDPAERWAVFVTEGRDQQTVEQFAGFLKARGGNQGQITEVCQGVSCGSQRLERYWLGVTRWHHSRVSNADCSRSSRPRNAEPAGTAQLATSRR